MQLEQKIASLLKDRQETLCLAESCTGGYLTHRLTNISGSSKFLIAAVISYANIAKIQLLHVHSASIRKDGAVSLSVVRQMAANAAKLFDTDYGLAITGIAGPTGGSAKKPVGLVYIAVKNRKKLYSQKRLFHGTRIAIKKQAAQKALELLLKAINS